MKRNDDTACVSVGVVLFCFAMAGILEGSGAIVAVSASLAFIAIAWRL